MSNYPNNGQPGNGQWPEGESQPWPQSMDLTKMNTSQPASPQVVGTFANFLEGEDEVYMGSDGKYRTVLNVSMLRQDGTEVKFRLPTELVLGFMQRCVDHLATIHGGFQYYDAPNAPDNIDGIEELDP